MQGLARTTGQLTVVSKPAATGIIVWLNIYNFFCLSLCHCLIDWMKLLGKARGLGEASRVGIGGWWETKWGRKESWGQLEGEGS